MATLSVTYANFVNGTPSDADEIDQNFSDIVTFVNANVIHKDGTIAMTGKLSSDGTDPTADNHMARKAYVDATALAQVEAAMRTSDNVAYSDITSVTTSYVSTGTDTMTDPGRKVILFMSFESELYADLGAAANLMTVEYSYSTDGGATYTVVAEPDLILSNLDSEWISRTKLVQVTPTGSIKLKVRIKANSADSTHGIRSVHTSAFWMPAD
jgi:hypothetical protein